MMLAQGAGKPACKAGEIKPRRSAEAVSEQAAAENDRAGVKEAGLNVLTHSLIPPNDGGIAIGQALYGSNKLMKEVDGDGKGV